MVRGVVGLAELDAFQANPLVRTIVIAAVIVTAVTAVVALRRRGTDEHRTAGIADVLDITWRSPERARGVGRRCALRGQKRRTKPGGRRLTELTC